MKTMVYEGHSIQIPGMSFTGKEEIKYDGKVISSKHTMLGGTHIFSVVENEEKVDYEVEMGARWHGFSPWAITGGHK